MSDSTKLSFDQIGILDTCAAIEAVGADIYWYFAKCYADTPGIRELWEKTAREEENHAKQFQLASRLHGEGIASLKSNDSRVKHILDKIRSIFENVRKSPPPLVEALRFSIKMEYALSEFHMNEMAIFEDRKIAQLFESMMNNDRDHIRMLEQE
jgi:rubrerythrin